MPPESFRQLKKTSRTRWCLRPLPEVGGIPPPPPTLHAPDARTPPWTLTPSLCADHAQKARAVRGEARGGTRRVDPPPPLAAQHSGPSSRPRRHKVPPWL